MIDIVKNIIVVNWFAKDLHYYAKGPGFYSLHLLADRVGDFGGVIDDIFEAYYLGAMGANPPSMRDVSVSAAEMYDGIKGNSGSLLKHLYDALDSLVHVIELKKKDSSFPSGIHAILDEISKTALTYRFLMSSEISNEK